MWQNSTRVRLPDIFQGIISKNTRTDRLKAVSKILPVDAKLRGLAIPTGVALSISPSPHEVRTIAKIGRKATRLINPKIFPASTCLAYRNGFHAPQRHFCVTTQFGCLGGPSRWPDCNTAVLS